jgi:hypothetical protein|tara:strand:- start:376 stop:675 length:300 start_codon:yes stop_codon:yes gene_type:complete
MWRVNGDAYDWFFWIGAYLVRCGDALSQLINVVFFLSQNPNESISGRSYRQQEDWFWGGMMFGLNLLFRPFERSHCEKAHRADLRRAAQLTQENLNGQR